MKKKNILKTSLKIIGIVLGILILALLAYIVYLYASYYRIEDNQELVVEAPVDDTATGIILRKYGSIFRQNVAQHLVLIRL